MSYIVQEKGQLTGQPVECYLFSSTGFATPYRYTSTDEDVAIGINNYEAIYIKRSQPELSRDSRAQQIVVTVDRENELARRWLVVVPPAPVFLTIFRFHNTDGGTPEVVTFWQGKVRSVEFSGNEAQFVAQPIDFSFSRVGLRNNFGPICSHQHYDSGCKVDVNDFSHTGVVESVNGVTLSSLAFGFFPDSTPVPQGWWESGFVQNVDTGELRMVVSHYGTNNTEVDVLMPFEQLSIGDSILLAAGCAHDSVTCDVKFDNLVNFLAFEYVPGEHNNPFTRNILR